MNWIKTIKKLFGGQVRDWLRDRALVFPGAKKLELAKQFQTKFGLDGTAATAAVELAAAAMHEEGLRKWDAI